MFMMWPSPKKRPTIQRVLKFMHNIHAEKILILDFGSQYTQLIARRVRELGVYSEIHPYDWDAESIKQFDPKGIILSGGPESVHVDNSPKADPYVFEAGVPVLGICYGMQTMVQQLGGRVEAHENKEFGSAALSLRAAGEAIHFFAGLPDDLSIWMSHGDQVHTLPKDFITIASTDTCPHAAIQHASKPLFGVQFHPEVSHTPDGMKMIGAFLKDICHCECLWSSEHIIEDAVKVMRDKVGTDQVILGLSGGVDSSVVAALLHKAIGSQLTCVFVDTGLLRLNEGDEVMKTMADNMGIKVIRVNAQQRFMNALKGESDPEAKRKIIGRVFVDIFTEEAAKLENAAWLAQGTIYPDVVESAATKHGKAHVIKSHHNVGGLPENMKLKLLEPLRELFKDEVRAMGVALGLPRSMIYCHPFPGPGLGVRVLGEITQEACDILRKADAIYIEELRNSGWYDKTAQAFAVFLPVKSVAVMGDARVYEPVIALRAVESIDFMTAHWAKLPYELLEKISSRICNEVKGISRVVYDISSKPPATIEWE
jgi:GMP synthase (glutamine-hydrolysing)